MSPVTGTVLGTFDPYASVPGKAGHYKAITIRSDDGYVVRLLYVTVAGFERGDRVEAGKTRIGIVQDLSPMYPGITNHLHLDVQRGAEWLKPSKKVVPLDPTPLVHFWQAE